MRTTSFLVLLSLVACGPKHGGETKHPDGSHSIQAAAPKVELARPASPGKGEPTPVLLAMRAELSRAQAAFSKLEGNKPYYFGYRVTEVDTLEIAATRGALELSSRDRQRVLDLEMRVGDHTFDNYHWRHRSAPGMAGTRMSKLWGMALPVDDDVDAITVALWTATDRAYKDATASYDRAKAQKQLAAKSDDDTADFSKEQSVQAIEPTATLTIDQAAWESRLRKISDAFTKHEHLHGSEVRLVAAAENRYIVTNEGSDVQSGRGHARLILSATTKADDGMDLQHADIIDVSDLSKMPDDAALVARVDVLAGQLAALRNAPVAEPFTGPAILEGRAAAVYFHEVFGHRVEGHRQEDENEGQTFADKVGTSVMPAFIDVYDDPTIGSLDGIDLNGHYRHDDEGLPAQRATLVDGGKLVGFLMSRTPAKKFDRSNGHGRAQAGADVVARQGNLIVAPREGIPKAALDDKLVELVREQGAPYGLRFVDIGGGVTNTSRYMAQAFQVNPVLVYRVFPDGKEELVRGVTLEGTPLSSLGKIVAAGDRYEVFNGYCGAESGWIPVSGASPPLLLSQIEVARAPAEQDRPPLLPPPGAAAAGGAR
jgi:predicted Zn-dependent protease